MTVSEKHREIAEAAFYGRHERGFVLRPLVGADLNQAAIDRIAAALAAAEREGREDERKRCTKIVLATANVMRIVGIGKIDAAVANALDVASIAIANGEEDTHSVALPPPGATEAGSVPPPADPATNHASRNGEG